MTTTTALGNQKGGVGKTTVSLCLLSELARLGRSALLIDLDQQMSASSTVGAEGEVTIEDVLRAKSPAPLSDAIEKSQWEGIDVVPGSDTIQTLERDPDVMAAFRLRKVLRDNADLLSKYDDVIIDLPPDLGTCTVSGLLAADQVIAVTIPEPWSSEGLDRFLTTLEGIRQGPHPSLSLFGVIVNMVRRTNEHRYRIDELNESVGGMVLQPVIPQRVAAAEVASEQLPLHELKNEGAKVLSDLFAEHAKALAEGRKGAI